jgi:hypothetical protein
MSDQNAFGGPASTAVVDPAVDEETASVSNRPKPIVFIVAGAVLLVLAAAAYFLVFSGGGDSTDTGTVPVVKPRVSTAPSTVAKTPTAAPSVAVAGVGTGSGIDPFRALPVVASGSPSAAPTATPTASAGATTGTTPAGVTSTLQVNSVNFAAKTANVTVDGKTMTVSATTLFAKYYMLRAVVEGPAQCAVFTFGDLPAQLCKGQKATFTS